MFDETYPVGVRGDVNPRAGSSILQIIDIAGKKSFAHRDGTPY